MSQLEQFHPLDGDAITFMAGFNTPHNFSSSSLNGFASFLAEGLSDLDSVELIKLDVPVVAPLEAAHGTQRVRQSILVRIHDGDGTVGVGECVALEAPTYTSEWRDGSWYVLGKWLVPDLLQTKIFSRGRIKGHPMALASLEMALADIYLQKLQMSLATLLGVNAASVSSRAVIGVGVSPTPLSTSERLDALITVVSDRITGHHKAVKIKISPFWSTDPVAAIRSIWPNLDLAVDANGAYSQEPELLAALDKYQLSYIEQPFLAHELIEHQKAESQLDTPLALDESIGDVGQLRLALSLGIGGLINVKPWRLGGLLPTMEAHELLVQHGMPAFCGGMYELGLGRGLALVVAGLPALGERPSDLGPNRQYVPRDVASDFSLTSEGLLVLPQQVGIGSTVDEDMVAMFETARIRISRHDVNL